MYEYARCLRPRVQLFLQAALVGLAGICGRFLFYLFFTFIFFCSRGFVPDALGVSESKYVDKYSCNHYYSCFVLIDWYFNFFFFHVFYSVPCEMRDSHSQRNRPLSDHQ